jgi:ferredoxin/flavodoxin---NADP+ reductase
MELDAISAEFVESGECAPTNKRNVEIFSEFAQREPEGKRKRVIMKFLRSPVEIQGDGRVEKLIAGVNELVRDESGAIKARDTGEREEIECGLVLRSIGYKGVGLEGLPFDSSRGVIPNEAGRVVDPESDEQVAGHYAVGWIKRGPSGVIGTNKKDAQETIDALFADLAAGKVPEREPVEPEIEELLAERAPDHVTYDGWEAIDAAEVAAGEPHGRPRIKFCNVEEMVDVAKQSDPVAR